MISQGAGMTTSREGGETSGFNGATLESTSACGVSSFPSLSDFCDNLRMLHAASNLTDCDHPV